MKSMYTRGILVGAIVGILAVGVSFAAFASTLTINGTAQMTGDFNVKFTAASATDSKSTTTVPAIDASTGVLSFDTSVNLEEPGSSSVINYTISNLGTIDATLATPTITCYSDSAKTTTVTCSQDGFLITAGALNNSEIVGSTGTATGSITVGWDSESTEVPQNTTRYFTVSIAASQKQ